MNIALTGGTGFIGSHFLHQALAAGHNVLALKRSPSSCPRIQMAEQPQWLERQLDEVMAEELRGCEVLVHLAAHTGNVPYDSLANCLQWNLFAVLALFEQARLAGIRRFVVAGSCFEYGRSGERYAAIPTDAPLEPTNSYAASKAAASIALCQWAEEHMLTLDLLRVFHVYGEGEPETRFWPSLRRAAMAGEDFPMTAGEQIRDFQPVEQVAGAFLARASSIGTITQTVKVWNLKSNHSYSLRNFAFHWWTAWEAKGSLVFGALPYRDHEIMRFIPCSVSALFLSKGSGLHSTPTNPNFQITT
jgi:nucleoside-diphosphate-sugar epimerase